MPESKQEVTKVVSLVQNGEHLPNVPDRKLSAVEAAQMRMHSSMLAL